jgi:single-strand DNA-binding protein
MLYIEGKIRTSSWEDTNGEKKYSTEIIADKLQMLGKKDDERPREKTQTRPPVSKPTQASPFDESDDDDPLFPDDLPFA